MKEKKLSSEAMKNILSAKTSADLIASLKNAGIVKEAAEGEKICETSVPEEEKESK